MVAGQSSNPILYWNPQQTRQTNIGFLSGIVECNLPSDPKRQVSASLIERYMRDLMTGYVDGMTSVVSIGC